MKPMLASLADLDKVVYPVYGSPKFDGVRAFVDGHKLLSRTRKEIPNHYIYDLFSRPEFEGLDGELIVGPPTSKTVYRDTVSGVMSHDRMPTFRWYVFDKWTAPKTFEQRRIAVQLHVAKLQHPCIIPLKHTLLADRYELDQYEAEQVALGYEGVMLNRIDALYKFGRATPKGAELLKVKRFEDSEAVVLGVVEEEHNANPAEVNELGRTKRSSAKEGKIGKGTMGALHVRDWKSGVEFHLGAGFTAADRAMMWEKPPIGLTVKYKFFPIGVKDKPRHPVFLGYRPAGA